jgi:hypothetical protein
MYESRSQKLATRDVFYRRIARNLLMALCIMAVSLIIGTVGFHAFCPTVRWLDAFHNSAMLLSGMGPVINNLCDPGIWFSSFYALFAGIVFITTSGLILAPVIHRFFHKFHLQEK